jgi:hypothetical protein
MFIEQGCIQRINFEIFNRFGYYNYHLIHWTASWLLGITYVTNIKGIHYPSSTDGMMHFFDPICFYAHFFCFYHGRFTSWCVTCTIRRFSVTTARPKIDWNRSFSFLYGLFYHCFYVTFFLY